MEREEMKSRVLVAVVGVPLLIYIVLWGPRALLLGALCVLSAIAARELMRCVTGKRALFAPEAVLAAVAVGWFGSGERGLYAVMVLLTIFLFAWAVIGAGKVKFDQIMAALFSGLLIPWSFSSFLRLERAELPRVYLLLPFLLSFACDTFAFFVGRAFGRRKLAPVVSPHKTVEGAIGGLAGNLLCGLLFVFVMRRVSGEAAIGYGQMALISLLCGAAAQIGDLTFSLFKREFGIKDYGHLFLEHGGVLDRFDSVLFVAPVAELFLTWML